MHNQIPDTYEANRWQDRWESFWTLAVRAADEGDFFMADVYRQVMTYCHNQWEKALGHRRIA